MRKEEYEKKDGTKGSNLKLEPGDEITPKYNEAREAKFGKYTNYSIAATWEGTEEFISLTKAQAEKIKKIGEVKDKTLVAYEYENEYGKQVSLKLKE